MLVSLSTLSMLVSLYNMYVLMFHLSYVAMARNKLFFGNKGIALASITFTFA